MWHQGYYIKLKLSVANILDRKKEMAWRKVSKFVGFEFKLTLIIGPMTTSGKCL